MFFIIFIYPSAFCQSWGDSTLKDGIIFTSVQEPPKFPGGNKAYYQFIADNLKKPTQSHSTFSNKLVIVRSIIGKDGNILFAEIEKGINEHYNEAVLELVRKMPAWTPAKQNRKAVPCYQSIPIVFVE